MEYEPRLRYRFPVGPLGLLGDLLTAPDYELKDVQNYVRAEMGGDAFFGETMNGPLAKENLPALGTDFPIPFFIVQGEEDDITPASLARAYFDQITAPRKGFYVIPDAGHMALFTRSDLFLKVLEANVRPPALKSRVPGF